MRGTAAGEGVVSQAQTKDWDENHERIFGKGRRPQRGRWVFDEAQGKLVRADEYQAPIRALDAPIMVDRFMEGSRATDGADLGSRAKRKEYMRQTGVTDSSDYSKDFYAKRREAKERATNEATKRAVVEVSKLDTRHLPKFIEEGKKR